MGSFQDFVDAVGGANSNENFNKDMAGVQGPTSGAYQIAGLGNYTNQLSGLIGQSANNMTDLSGATQGAVSNQQALQQYLQSVATGGQNTAADAMFQTGQAQNAQQAQSAAVSAGGMNPALAMRQILGAQSAGMGNITGQAAQQKLQEQQQAATAAGQNNQALYNMQFQNAQQQFANQQSQINQQSQLGQQIFQANQAQTGYNVQFQQNQQAFQQWTATQQMQQQQSQAQALSKFIQMGVQAAGSIAGAATGVGAVGSIASLAGNLAGGLASGAMSGGGGGGMQQAFAGGGQYQANYYNPYTTANNPLIGNPNYGSGQ